MLGTKSIDDILKFGGDINLLISDRGGHKSTDIQLFLFNEWKKREKKSTIAFLCRPKSDEIVGAGWFSEFARNEIEKQGYEISDKNVKGFPRSREILLNNKPFVIVLYASLSAKYKSNYLKGFETVEYGVLEECVEENQGQNYKGILRGFLSIANTICRRNPRTLFLLGNDILLPNFSQKILDEVGFFDDIKYNEIVESSYYFFDDYKKDGKYKVVSWYFGEKEKPNYLLPLGDIYELQKNDDLVEDLGYRFKFDEKTYGAGLFKLQGSTLPTVFVGDISFFENPQKDFETFKKENLKFLKDENLARIKLLQKNILLKSDEDPLLKLFEIENQNKKNVNLKICDFTKISYNKSNPVFLSSSENLYILNLKRLFRQYPFCFSDRKIKSVFFKEGDY